MSGRERRANIPESYRHLTLSNSPAREGQPEIYELLSEYAATFARQFDDDSPPIKSLYLYSHEPGTGKTTTAAAILNEFVVRHYVGAIKRGRQPVEVPAYFLDVNAWQSDFNEFNRPKVPDEIAEPAAERYYRAQKRAMTAPFVVLDDVGVRECSEAFRADLHRIINARVTAGLPTVYTSNIPLSEINDVFREVPARLADRMRDLCAVLTFKGGSKRGLQRREGTANER